MLTICAPSRREPSRRRGETAVMRAGQCKCSIGGFRRFRFALLRGVAATLSLVFAAVPRTSGADYVDCDTPDDFCVGDPCQVAIDKRITVTSCVLDFMGRTLEVNARVLVPNGGVLDLSAGTITVNARIKGNHTRPADGDGADVSLTATAGNIVVDAPVDVSGRVSTGNIALAARGDIDVQSRLRARAKGGVATGGVVAVAADGTLRSTSRGRIDVRGKRKDTAAGQVVLTGANGVVLEGRVLAGGSSGATVVIASTSGDVAIEEELRAQGGATYGGSVIVSAPVGSVTVGGVKGNARADGFPGGAIKISAAGAVTLGRGLRARGLGLSNGGTITVTSTSGDVTHSGFFAESRRGGVGGNVTLTAAGTVAGNGPIHVGGVLVGGVVQVSATGDAVISRYIDASGDDGGSGGAVEISAMGEALIDSAIEANGDEEGTGGCIKVASLAGDVKVDVGLAAASELGKGGLVVLEGSGVVAVNDGADVRVDGGELGGGGYISVSGTNLTLAGNFHANGEGAMPGGIIEAIASGSLTTCGGEFVATPPGCIALDPQDLCGAFDPPPSDSCGPVPTQCLP